MRDTVNQPVTVEHFDSGLAMLHARVGGQSSRIDSVQTQSQAKADGFSSRNDSLRIEMRADTVRSQPILASNVIAPNALMLTVLGISLNQGAIM